MKNCALIKQGEAFLLDVDGRTLPLYAYMTYQPEKGALPGFFGRGRPVGVRGSVRRGQGD